MIASHGVEHTTLCDIMLYKHLNMGVTIPRVQYKAVVRAKHAQY